VLTQAPFIQGGFAEKPPFQGERWEMVWLVGFRGKVPFRGGVFEAALGGVVGGVVLGGWEGGGWGGRGGWRVSKQYIVS
jgi:hypothetical protein